MTYHTLSDVYQLTFFPRHKMPNEYHKHDTAWQVYFSSKFVTQMSLMIWLTVGLFLSDNKKVL